MKSQREHYDAVVIGAGPAGSSAASQLAQAGLKTLIVEQQRTVGQHVQCAEFVPLSITRYSALRDCDIAQPVKGIKTYINGEIVSVLRAPGYILNRALWDHQQAEAAKANGAIIMTGTRAVSIEGKILTCLSDAKKKEISTNFILGCDGPRSIVSAQLKNQPQGVCVALQYEMLLAKPLLYAKIFFDLNYYGGYAWIFPKGKTANVGVAINEACKDRVKPMLEDFSQTAASMGLIKRGTTLAVTGGLIPSGGLVWNLANDFLLVAGDAAGCTHPITGAGIMNAVVSGHLAAKAVIGEANSSKLELAQIYRSSIHAEFSASFKIAGERLKSRNNGWPKEKHDFTKLIRRSWIAFPEYYAQIDFNT